MISALIIDDEQSAINTLKLMLQRYVPEISTVNSCNDPAAGLLLITEKKPDLLFLDIQMPGMSGFSLLKATTPGIPVIFTTAFDRYAIEAIRFSALDYLLKPIDADELKAAVARFITTRNQAGSQQLLYNNLLHNISVNDQRDFKLALPTISGTYFFSPEQIIRLEAESNYTRFHFSAEKPLLISKTMKEYEEILGNHGFIRIHKSHIVNKKHVVSFHSNDGVMIMNDRSRVEVSRRRKDEISLMFR